MLLETQCKDLIDVFSSLHACLYIVMPSVHLNVSDGTVYIGDNVTIYCRGYGYPRPNTSVVMANGSIFSVRWLEWFRATIKVGQFAEGGGVYSCSSRNAFGTAQNTTTVNGKCYLRLNVKI